MATTTITIANGQPGLTDYKGQFLNASNANVGGQISLPAPDADGNSSYVATIPATATQINASSATTGFNSTQVIVVDGAASGGGGIDLSPGIHL